MSGSSWPLAEGLVLLQATDLFLHPFPQVREHCIGTERNGSGLAGGPRPSCAPQGSQLPPPPISTLPKLPLPRAQRSKWAGSSGRGRPGGWRGRAAGTGWLRPSRIGSGLAVSTGPLGSACRHRTSGCRRSSSPRTSWEGTKRPIVRDGATFPGEGPGLSGQWLVFLPVCSRPVHNYFSGPRGLPMAPLASQWLLH